MSVAVHNELEFKNAVGRVCKTLQAILATKNSTRFEKDEHKIMTRLQLAIELKSKIPLDRVIHEFIVSTALNAERNAPGAFDVCLTLTIDELLRNIDGIPNLCSKEQSRAISKLQARSATMHDLESCIDKICSEKHKSLVKTAIELAGFCGKIYVDRSESKNSTIELFESSVFNDVRCPLVMNAIKLKNARVVIVDGTIENEHEIHSLLVQASEDLVPVVTFARNVSDDVLHSIKVNNDRGKTNFHFVIVPLEPSTFKSMLDIETITGSSIISSDKGDLISGKNLSSFPSVRSIVLERNQARISVCDRDKQIAGLLSSLKAELSASNDEMVRSIIASRIRSISGRFVQVSLNNDQDVILVTQQVDLALRSIKSLISHGAINRIPAIRLEIAKAFAGTCANSLAEICYAVIKNA